MKTNKPKLAIAVIAAAVLVAAGVIVSTLAFLSPTDAPVAAVPVPSHSATTRDKPYTPPTPEQMAGLTEARYDKSITALIALTNPIDFSAGTTTWQLKGDSALYADDETTPVAKLLKVNFLGQPTTVVAARTAGPWTLILTPARKSLPSQSKNGVAPAQTLAWIRTSQLTHRTVIHSLVTVSTSKGTLTIHNGDTTTTFTAGIGRGTVPDPTAAPTSTSTPGQTGTAELTPSPTNVTGYLEARYLDPNQGQATYPINLTSLHSTVKDEPIDKSVGGPIGIHYETTATGQVSHGCIRLSPAGITAMSALPLGTPITIAN